MKTLRYKSLSSNKIVSSSSCFADIGGVAVSTPDSLLLRGLSRNPIFTR